MIPNVWNSFTDEGYEGLPHGNFLTAIDLLQKLMRAFLPKLKRCVHRELVGAWRERSSLMRAFIST